MTPAPITWDSLYSEAELYKAAVRLYTKPLFQWRKALHASSDGKTLYDFARHGLEHLDGVHRALAAREFHFRPGLALHYNFNGKRRVIYLYPWEERLVDLLLYRLLNRALDACFSPNSYAYRHRRFGLDRCQRRIAATLRSPAPLYLVKRDIADFFPSIDHEVLLGELAAQVAPHDYLWELLRERVRFAYCDGDAVCRAARGVPFGTPIACFFANLYLTPLDRALEQIPGVTWFRYADDLLAVSAARERAQQAAAAMDEGLARLRLASKPTHEQSIVFARQRVAAEGFVWSPALRHLGLEFRAGGQTGLSRDKARKICNLFRFAFRRHRRKLARAHDPEKRARAAIELARRTIEHGVRHVAILDYYLKHVEDEAQLRRLDRWLAEEVLSIAFRGGHRKGYFRRLPFERLRAMGLPSLVHRRRLIQHGKIPSPFFLWKNHQAEKSSRGKAARPRRASADAAAAFSPYPEAAVAPTS